MTELSALYARAEQMNIPVFHRDLPRTCSVSMTDGRGRCWIGVDRQSSRTEDEQRVGLAHELGHCVTGSFYNRLSPGDIRRLHENRADRWAVETLIPVQALDEAVASGITEPWELAEHFGVDVPFLQKAVSLYVHGNLASELYF